MTASKVRCFVCAARALTPTDRTLVYANGTRRAFALACGACGVLVDDPATGEACRTDLAARLSAQAYRSDAEQPYGFDVFTLRIAATAQGRGLTPNGDAQIQALRQPHAQLAAAAHLFDLAAAPSRPVALGALCRPDEAEGLARRLAAEAPWAAEIVLLADGPSADPVTVAVDGTAGRSVRLACRPLADDFAAQRNALTALSPRDWMLQLDADEALAPGTGALLGALAALAEATDAVSIGLSRRNRVDGVLSDLYPDTQYRLNHRSLAYQGRVHERPQRDWRRSFIALHGAIEHALTRRHVETRSRRYDAILPGVGRMQEAVDLLAPYRP